MQIEFSLKQNDDSCFWLVKLIKTHSYITLSLMACAVVFKNIYSMLNRV